MAQAAERAHGEQSTADGEGEGEGKGRKELYGEWQTRPYEAPWAVDGKVPRTRDRGDREGDQARVRGGRREA